MQLKRAVGPAIVVATVALMAACIVPAGRFPAEDAPGLLATAAATAREPWEALALVIPHPPLGYLLAAWPWALGFDQAAPVLAAGGALALCWWGMRALSGRPPLGAWVLFVATPMTWLAVENLHWDLLLAGLSTAALGALHRDRPWLAGGLMAGAVLTKLNAPLFLALPALVWLVQKRDPRLLIGAVCIPWLLWHHDTLGVYLGASVAPDGDSAALAKGPSSPWTYLAALRVSLGWPGLALVVVGCGLGWRNHRALVAGVGGVVLLSLLARKEARYLLPALPPLLVAAEAGLGRFRGLMGVGVVQLVVSAKTFATFEEPRSLRVLELPLLDWDWPLTPAAFQPMATSLEGWDVDTVLQELPSDVPVALLFPNHPAVPIPEHLHLRAEQLGLDVQLVAVALRPGQDPLIRPLPWGRTDWQLLYVVDRTRGPARDWADRQDLQPVWYHPLPMGHEGQLLERP